MATVGAPKGTSAKNDGGTDEARLSSLPTGRLAARGMGRSDWHLDMDPWCLGHREFADRDETLFDQSA